MQNLKSGFLWPADNKRLATEQRAALREPAKPIVLPTATVALGAARACSSESGGGRCWHVTVPATQPEAGSSSTLAGWVVRTRLWLGASCNVTAATSTS
jgi:hypothetical protein